MGMGQRLRLRELTMEERQAVERVARSRTAPARQVERAKVVLAALEGEGVGAIAQRFDLSPATVYLWWHRFEELGLAGLQDKPRQGRPPTYTREQVGLVVATALTDPQTLGQPFASWTLDRLAAYLAERHGITVYDAAYLEIAVRRKIPLATLDRELSAAARAEEIHLLGI